MVQIFVDADACPVKNEVVRVSSRHGLVVHIVSNAWMRVDQDPLVKQVVVSDGPDAADNWIAENAETNDIVITVDIPLAARCLDKGTFVLGHKGEPFTQNSIGVKLAMRDLNAHLREIGEMAGGERPFERKDRSNFLNELENLVQKARRATTAGKAG